MTNMDTSHYQIKTLVRDASDEQYLNMLHWYLNLSPGNERSELAQKVFKEGNVEREAFINLFSKK